MAGSCSQHEVSALKLELHTKDRNFMTSGFGADLGVRSPKALDMKQSGPKKLLENGMVREKLLECTQDLALTEQRLDMAWSMRHTR